jgi:hypothetical protein
MKSSKSYEWKAGRITWGGEQFNAFVISNLTPDEIEENPFSAIVGSRILAENSDLTGPPAKWAAFAKPNATLPEWRFLGSGSGGNSVPPPTPDLPEAVVQQLKAIA